GTVRAAVNDPNEYAGPGTGYRLEGDRWRLLQALPHVLDPRELEDGSDGAAPAVAEGGEAEAGTRPDEVVVAVGPAFGVGIRTTINGLPHDAVLQAVCAGVREAGGEPRLVRVRRVSDAAFLGHRRASPPGSG